MTKHRRIATAALALAAATTTASAADLYWQGGTAGLGSGNYLEPVGNTANSTPTASDVVYIGANGTATHAAGDLSLGRIVVGHNGNSTAGAPGAFPGAGTVEVTGGNVFTTTGSGVVPVVVPPLNGSPDAGLIVGHTANGSLSITNASVTVNDSIVVGFSQTDETVTGSLSVNTGGILNLIAGGLQLGANGTSTDAGASGNMTVAGGTVNISGTGADLVIGVWNKSTYVQTGGTVTVADETFVGRRNADFTSFALNGGGTLNTRNFNVADTNADGRIDNVTAAVTNGTLNVSGAINISERNSRTTSVTFGQGANVSVGGAISLAGTGSATTGQASGALDTTLNITGNANVTTGGAINLAATGLATGVGTRTALNVSGAAVVNGGGGLNVGSNESVSTSATISGSATVNIGAVLVGNRSSKNASLSIIEDGKLNTRGNLVIGDQVGTAVPDNSSLTISGNAAVSVGTVGQTGQQNLFLGRGNSTNTTFTMSGGTLYVDDLFLMSTAALAPTNVVANHSGGTLTVGIDVRVNDTGGGDSTYNLSGTGQIVSPGGIYVGRQRGLGTMNQTGGTMTLSGPIRIGDAQNAPTDKTVWTTGVYNISAGSVAVTVPAATAGLTIAPQGAGTMRVIGDDATIQINGDVIVNTTAAEGSFPAFVGTLAYQLEAGDAGLSMINATGTATFNAGSVLSLDLNGLTPAAGTSFDLLTATDIIDNGLVFSAPAGWSFQILAGGNGELLRALSAPAQVAGDVNGDGVVNLGDINYVTARWLNAGPAGDANGDGVVNLGDINYITARWLNTSEPGGVSVAALAAVPEPASLGLLGLATLGLAARRRRNA